MYKNGISKERIDELLKQNEELAFALAESEASNIAKREFLSNMSHDVRTLTSSMLGMTAIAQANIDNKEKVMDSLEKVIISGRHLLGLINSALDMSKIESGTMEFTSSKFNIVTAIQEVEAVMHSQISSKHINFTINTELQHEECVGDVQKLQQVVVNLVSNAVKFTDDNGRVEIGIAEHTSHKEGKYLYEITVADNGMGMEPEVADKIFKPFFRAEDSRVRNIEGTGLGMAICHNILRLMDGTIDLESIPNVGTTVRVKIYFDAE
jgi:signal transduction histidine kinase